MTRQSAWGPPPLLATLETMPNPLAASVIDLYLRHGEQWAALRHAQPVLETAWLERFASGLADGGDALDLGCGNGWPIAAWLAARRFALTGIDTASALLGEAIGSFNGDPLFHASLAPEEYRDRLNACGFEVVAFTPEDPACGSRTV